MILTKRLKPSEDLSIRRPEMLWQKSLALVLDSTSNTCGHNQDTVKQLEHHRVKQLEHHRVKQLEHHRVKQLEHHRVKQLWSKCLSFSLSQSPLTSSESSGK